LRCAGWVHRGATYGRSRELPIADRIMKGKHYKEWVCLAKWKWSDIKTEAAMRSRNLDR
jgi:hypothetical protein